MPTLSAANRIKLREDLSRYFSAEELDTLCVDMGEDYDVVPGRGQGELVRAREIIDYFEARGRLPELLALCSKQRPSVDWQARLIPDSAFATQSQPANRATPKRVASTAFTVAVLAVICLGIALVGFMLSVFRGGTPPSGASAPVAGSTTAATAAATAAATTAATAPSAPAQATMAAAEPTRALDAIAPPPEPTPTPQPPEALNISNSPGGSERPRLIVDEQGVLHAFWLDNTLRRGEGYDVLHRLRLPSGEWSAAENLTEGFNYMIRNRLATLVAPSGRLCLFFEGQDEAIGNVTYGLYMRCRAEGAWQAPEFIERIQRMGSIPALIRPTAAPSIARGRRKQDGVRQRASPRVAYAVPRDWPWTAKTSCTKLSPIPWAR